jgi:hypothetical protein
MVCIRDIQDQRFLQWIAVMFELARKFDGFLPNLNRNASSAWTL